MVNAKTFLEKRYNDELELEDAVHTAILTLKVLLCILYVLSLLIVQKEGFEGQMTEHNIEIGVVDANGFRRLQVLSPSRLCLCVLKQMSYDAVGN